MSLTRAQIEQIALKLRAMPAAPPTTVSTTKQEAVKLLANEIASLQRRGYTLEQITASLRGEGLDLTTPTLKSYLSRAKTAKARRRIVPATPAKLAPSSRAATPLPPKEAVASPKAEPLAKSGKDAFLVKDKDSY